AAGFFLTAAAAAANLVPHLREAVSIRTVERLVVVALIVILFDGGLKVGWHRFRRAVLPIGVLGIVGTAGTAALTTVFAHYLVGFHWLLAGVVGAALAPTDPAVMFSVLRGQQLGGRASTVVEGESGVNDPVSIALVVGLLEYHDAREHGSLLVVVARELAVQTGVGLAIGCVVGSTVPYLLRHARFPSEGLYGIAGLVAAAFAYGAASYVGGSGFLAVFIVGVLLGAERTPQKGQIDRFSEALASFSEMVVFAALGLTINLATLGSQQIWLQGLLLALLLIFVARPLVVLPLLAPLRLRWGERLFIAWAGMKGAVPILLAALAVLARLDSSAHVYGIVSIVVLSSVVLQGATVRVAANRLAVPLRWTWREPPIVFRRGSGAAPAVQRYVVSETSRAAGSALRDLPLGSRSWVDLIVRGGRENVPRGRDVIRPGDEIVVTSDTKARAASVRRLLEEPRPGRGSTVPKATKQRRRSRGEPAA
ncbi:MAG: cation:proton antiporter domain-containing protein, partial [Gaiellaceae bacterium]